MENKKCNFSEIKIGEEFILHNNEKIILVKTDEGHYCIKGQSRVWRVSAYVDYAKI